MSTTTTKPQEVKLTEIEVSETNPRKAFDKESISELAKSIKEIGVIQPVMVRPHGKKYQLVCGERRYRASLEAGKETIPVVVRELSDAQVLEIQITENLQRKDVHYMEEAAAFKMLVDGETKVPIEEVAKRIGKRPTYVATRMRLTNLIEEFQKAAYKNRMYLQDALIISKLDAEDQKDLWKERFKGNGSEPIRIQQWHINKYLNDLTKAPFNIQDETLMPTMGKCTACPMNSGANSLLFPDEKKQTCLKPSCYKQKCELAYQKELSVASADPTIVLVHSDHDGKISSEEEDKLGHKVYFGKDYNEVMTPEEPPYADYKERLDDGDYETKKAMEADYKKDMETYKKELASHNKAIEKGKYLKAFVIGGADQGRYIWITWRKEAGKQGKLEAGEKEEKFDVKAEVQRLKDNAKRKYQIDENRLQVAMFDHMVKDKKYRQQKGVLTVTEKAAQVMVLLMSSENFNQRIQVHAAKETAKLFGLGDTTYPWKGLFEKLCKLSGSKLTEISNALTRALIMEKLQPGNEDRPETSGKAAMFRMILREHDRKAMDKLIKEVDESQVAYKERLEQRIANLKKQQ